MGIILIDNAYTFPPSTATGLCIFLTLLYLFYFSSIEELIGISLGNIVKIPRYILYISSIFAGYAIFMSGAGYLLIAYVVLLPKIAYGILYAIDLIYLNIWVQIAVRGYLGGKSENAAKFFLNNPVTLPVAKHISRQTLDREHMQEFYEEEILNE